MLGFVIGGIVAVVAVGFVETVLALNDVTLVSPGSRAERADERSFTILAIAVPTIAGLLVGLLGLLLKHRGFHGPPDAIRAAHTAEADMPVRGGIVSADALNQTMEDGLGPVLTDLGLISAPRARSPRRFTRRSQASYSRAK